MTPRASSRLRSDITCSCQCIGTGAAVCTALGTTPSSRWISTVGSVMHGSGQCGQVLKVDDAKRCSSHSSILALLAGVRSNGSATGRTGTTVRGGQVHESIESAVCAKLPALRLPCLSVNLVGGCWVTEGLPLRRLMGRWGIQSRGPSLPPMTGRSLARPH